MDFQSRSRFSSKINYVVCFQVFSDKIVSWAMYCKPNFLNFNWHRQPCPLPGFHVKDIISYTVCKLPPSSRWVEEQPGNMIPPVPVELEWKCTILSSLRVPIMDSTGLSGWSQIVSLTAVTLAQQKVVSWVVQICSLLLYHPSAVCNGLSRSFMPL